MQFLSRTRLLMGLALLAVAILPAGTVHGQGQKKNKEISFNTFDGVKIQGSLYPNPTGKRDAVVLLLHTFDLKKGGSSSQPGWSDLALKLQADGYTVLSFDFRGFGESTKVSKNFWMFPHNYNFIRGAAKKPESIAYKDFNGGYLRYLVNDIAAAKAYLDRRNDQKELNSSNVIVIGASEGATLGTMWLANECHRRRDTTVPPLPGVYPALAEQSEISDIACGVWLTISPKVGTVAGVTRWIVESSKKNKVPMVFVHGAEDKFNANLAKDYISRIKPVAGAKKETSLTGSLRIEKVSKLTGNKLLDKETDTIERIVKYLDKVLAERTAKEQKNRDCEKSAYYYVFPQNPKKWRKISKKAGQEAPEVDVAGLLLGN